MGKTGKMKKKTFFFTTVARFLRVQKSGFLSTAPIIPIRAWGGSHPTPPREPLNSFEKWFFWSIFLMKLLHLLFQFGFFLSKKTKILKLDLEIWTKNGKSKTLFSPVVTVFSIFFLQKNTLFLVAPKWCKTEIF